MDTNTPVTRSEYERLREEWHSYVMSLRDAEHSLDDVLQMLVDKRDYRVITTLGNTGDELIPSAACALYLMYIHFRIPSDVFYYLVLDVYMMARFEDSDCFEDIIPFLCYHIPADYLDSLPAKYRDRARLTVYRGTKSSDIDDVKYEFSWSLSKVVAKKFCERLRDNECEAHLYSATIRVKDILAYTNEREEQEILQDGVVFSIKEIPIDKGADSV